MESFFYNGSMVRRPDSVAWGEESIRVGVDSSIYQCDSEQIIHCFGDSHFYW